MSSSYSKAIQFAAIFTSGVGQEHKDVLHLFNILLAFWSASLLSGN